MVLAGVKRALERPVDLASMAAFRLAFGAVMTFACIRFAAHGLIRTDYVVPRHFFHYWCFEWVHPWPGIGMYVHYAIMTLAAVCIMLGIAYRASCVVFGAAFTYAHLCDKTNYLNHYYFVGLLSLLLVLLPLDRMWSVRVLLRPEDRRDSAHGWMLWLLRFQVALVYVFAGLAKIERDWLLHGEPLRIWLSANAELPLVGRWLQAPWVAIAFSWCGMLFDVTVVPLLLYRHTRRVAYALLVSFHAITSILFPIGIFPLLMTMAATVFFDPSWPRRTPAPPMARPAGTPLGHTGAFVLAVYAAVQLLMPLRNVLYPGNTLWTEEGFRFSWKVMLIEKSGELELTVADARGGLRLVDLHDYLTPFQARMVATQPDMILELAHIVADDYARRGAGPVRVYADAQVSFNGRRRAPLIDPTVDLAAERDGLLPKRWILNAPTTDPEF